MDARVVWDTWRKILQDDELVKKVTKSQDQNCSFPQDFEAEELHVMNDYASTVKATTTNIGMYRQGLVRLAICALNRVPLSKHLLLKTLPDIAAVASDFIAFNNYKDDGPYLWKIANNFISYIATRSEFKSAQFQDLLSLDQALISLAQHLSNRSVNPWPNDAIAIGEIDNDYSTDLCIKYMASHAATIASTSFDLTPWIVDPDGFNPLEELVQSRRYWLIYFPSAEDNPEYAELSQRSANLFKLLSTPMSAKDVAIKMQSLSPDEALQIIQNLSHLGVVHKQEKDMFEDIYQSNVDLFANDSFVILDPAVDILDDVVGQNRLLCHRHSAVGMAVPTNVLPIEFIAGLAYKPVQVGSLKTRTDKAFLVDKVLKSLMHYGFLYVTQHAFPSENELIEFRQMAHNNLKPFMCHSVYFKIDGSNDVLASEIIDEAMKYDTPCKLFLQCKSLAKHGPLFEELARLRKSNQHKWQHIVIQVHDLSSDEDLIKSLIALHAEIIIEGLDWPELPNGISSLSLLTNACVPVYARVKPDYLFFNSLYRERLFLWAKSCFLTGIYLDLDIEILWPNHYILEGQFVELFELVRQLDESLGDVRIINLPSDEVLLGKAALERPDLSNDLAKEFFTAYLRWRLPQLKAYEGDNLFSQTPEAEAKLVSLQDDFLPNHPQLLGLVPGSRLVDVCGGNGRVARRLSNSVGQEGLIVSVEMLRCVTERARRFATEGGFTNLQFRTGIAERLSLPDGVADAAVNEWTGAIWQLGQGFAMVKEMARVVRPGGRIAVTHRLLQMSLTNLKESWVQFDNIYEAMMIAFSQDGINVIHQKIWGQIVPSLAGENATSWRKHYMPQVINPFDVMFTDEVESEPRADICITIIAERL